MKKDARSIKEVLQTICNHGGKAVNVVLCNNGKLGIMQGDHLMPGLEWTIDKLSDCVSFAERLCQNEAS